MLREGCEWGEAADKDKYESKTKRKVVALIKFDFCICIVFCLRWDVCSVAVFIITQILVNTFRYCVMRNWKVFVLAGGLRRLL